jgi:hypothetical protein
VKAIVLPALTALALLVSTAAQAATVTSANGELRYAAAPGERNTVRLGVDRSGEAIVRDTTSPLVTGDGCRGDGPGRVRCAHAVTASIDLLDGDDRFMVAFRDEGLPATRVVCGDGTDLADVSGGEVASDCETVADRSTVVGTVGPDRLTGWRNQLTIFGRAGDDRLLGFGNDSLEGGSGNDVLRGGPGGRVSLRGGSGDDVVRGNRGRDYLAGGYGDDRLSGLGANDEINGGAGRDVIAAGDGSDQIVSKERGRERDRVTCGAGRDTVLADLNDVVSRDCEIVNRR